ncbi:putative S-layer domain protein [Candidatus Termititenax persephonae]|uniref:S-layer domain protein n=1 Tax=Candidatus Termititenax persephonae TaxID=2218525 RepID=A0A388TG51_9BACT|nr:putative S-layer domain protein [Candidatus Termititenax persephonae]
MGTEVRASANRNYSVAVISPDGTYYLRIQTVDAVGNTSAWQTVYTYVLDSTIPTGSVTINAGAEWTSQNSVTLTLDFSADVVSMNVDGGTPSGIMAVPLSKTMLFTLAGDDGEKTVTVTYYDAAGNTANPVVDTIKLDKTRPGMVEAGGILPPSTNPTPALSWTVTEPLDPLAGGVASGVTTYNIYWGDAEDGTAITAVRSSPNVTYNPTISGGQETTFNLRVQVVDALGNAGDWRTVWVYPFDDKPPTGSVSINVGFNESFTNSSLVTLNLAYSADVVSMNIADDDGQVSANLVPNAVYLWNFQADGEKIITVIFSDAAGNSFTATDSIKVDAYPPNLDAAYYIDSTAPTQNFALALEFSEEMLDTAVPLFSFDAAGGVGLDAASAWNAVSLNFYDLLLDVSGATGWVTVNLTGGAKDLAGNAAVPSPHFAVFYIDAIAPSGGVVINYGEALTGNPEVIILLDPRDDHSLPGEMFFMLVTPDSEVSDNAGITVNEWLPYQPTFSVNLEETLGTKNIAVRFKDKGGNESGLITASIVLDDSAVLWLLPTFNVVLDGNAVRVVSSNADTEFRFKSPYASGGADFYVSVNGLLHLITANIPPDQSGVYTYAWATLPLVSSGSTAAVEFYAAVTKDGQSVLCDNPLTVGVDKAAPSVTINVPNSLAINYVPTGSVIISGTATDNEQITAVDYVQVDIYQPDGTLAHSAKVPSASFADEVWEYTGWTIPALPSINATYNIEARAYDLLGNVSLVATSSVVKTDLYTRIYLDSPPTAAVSPRVWLSNPIVASGTVETFVELDRLEVTFNNSIFGNTVGTDNWTVSINPSASDFTQWTENLNPSTLTLSAVSIDNPPKISSQVFQFWLDGVPPNLVTINVTPNYHTAGTLNITGNFADAHSGVSAVLVSVNNATTTISSAANFAYVVNLSAAVPEMLIDFRALDSAYPTPNESAWLTYKLVYDEVLLPTAMITSPVSGSYVNNVMTVTGTAAVKDGSSVAGIWLDFGTGWVTAQITDKTAHAADWQYLWSVPSADPDGQTYFVSASVLSAAGMRSEVSPAVLAVYHKDSSGPTSNFLNLAHGIFLSQSQFMVAAETLTERAKIQEAYFMVDGVTQNPPFTLAPGASRSNDNVSWNYSWAWNNQTHEVFIRAVDTAGNWTDSPTISVRSFSDVLTDPLPPDGLIRFPNDKVYATSVNNVALDLPYDPAAKVRVSIAGSAAPPLPAVIADDGNGRLRVELDSAAQETVYLINILNPDDTLAYQQLVMYDITPPRVIYDLAALQKYYQGAIFSLDKDLEFEIRLVDRVASSNNKFALLPRGSGFNAPNFADITGADLAGAAANTVLFSIFQGGTTVNQSVADKRYDQRSETLSFKASLGKGTYDLALFAVDNAGNRMDVDFDLHNILDVDQKKNDNLLTMLDDLGTTNNIFVIKGLSIDKMAISESGGLDKKKFITAYPNPCDPGKDDLFFTYHLKDNASRARIMIYNQIGELLHVISVDEPGLDGTRVGYNQVSWDALDRHGRLLSNGVYIYMIVIEGSKERTFAKGTLVVIRR